MGNRPAPRRKPAMPCCCRLIVDPGRKQRIHRLGRSAFNRPARARQPARVIFRPSSPATRYALRWDRLQFPERLQIKKLRTQPGVHVLAVFRRHGQDHAGGPLPETFEETVCRNPFRPWPVLTPVNEGDAVKVGDKIRVRIELQVDRDMGLYMKDLRAASLEPTDVLSGYHWQGGLGYYQNTRDVSTNFFL